MSRTAEKNNEKEGDTKDERKVLWSLTLRAFTISLKVPGEGAKPAKRIHTEHAGGIGPNWVILLFSTCMEYVCLASSHPPKTLQHVSKYGSRRWSKASLWSEKGRNQRRRRSNNEETLLLWALLLEWWTDNGARLLPKASWQASWKMKDSESKVVAPSNPHLVTLTESILNPDFIQHKHAHTDPQEHFA